MPFRSQTFIVWKRKAFEVREWDGPAVLLPLTAFDGGLEAQGAAKNKQRFCAAKVLSRPCPRMGWTGRAPAPNGSQSSGGA